MFVVVGLKLLISLGKIAFLSEGQHHTDSRSEISHQWSSLKTKATVITLGNRLDPLLCFLPVSFVAPTFRSEEHM